MQKNYLENIEVFTPQDFISTLRFKKFSSVTSLSKQSLTQVAGPCLIETSSKGPTDSNQNLLWKSMSWFLYEIQSKVSQSKISCSKSIQAKSKQCVKSVIVNLNRFRNLFFFNVDFQQEDAGWVYVSYYNTSILHFSVLG